jgi:TetR/AcrR family transcriptional repressor of nem operon
MKSTSADVRLHILRVGKTLILGKGFTAVGLSELLTAAGVPKGSFYYYFPSKEAFGEALLDWYFSEHLALLDDLFAKPGPAHARLIEYCQYWLDTQCSDDVAAKCLAVKLSAEVSDLSESMRAALDRGTQGVIRRLAACVEAGLKDASLQVAAAPRHFATALYGSWLGASLLAKVARDRGPLDNAMAATRQWLALPASRH